MYYLKWAVSETLLAFLLDNSAINRELGLRLIRRVLSKLNMFCITAALMCGTAGLPHVIVRYFTVKMYGQ